jgi:hypothetical protein
VPGASWVLLDSAGAATCSAASLAVTVDGSRQTRKTQSPNSAFQQSDLCDRCSGQTRLVQRSINFSGDPEVMEDNC